MNDIDQDLQEMFRRREPDLAGIVVAPPGISRRVRRRQGVTVVTAGLTAAAIVAAVVVGLGALPQPADRTLPGDRTSPNGNGDIVAFRQGGIFRIDPVTGTGHKLIACPPQTDGESCNVRYHLAWSPNGRQLAFAVTRFLSGERNTSTPADEDLGVFVFDPGTRTARKIAPCVPTSCGDGAFAYSLDWSPDGSSIAVAEGDRITVLSVDGDRRTTLTETSGLVDGVAWAPDGTRIAYSMGGDLFIVRSDGGRSDRILDAQGGLGASEPAWSPDGTKIAYVLLTDYPEPVLGFGGWSTAAIWTVSPDGSKPTKLFEQGPCCWNGPHGGPAWSPDGTMLAFTLGGFEEGGDDVEYHMYVMDADGTDLRVLGEGSADGAAWRPVP
jgi:Tol biopolymer transport system component